MMKYLEMEIHGAADEPAYIDRFTDFEGGFVNSRFIPGNSFEIRGANIKVEGDESACGVFFVSADGSEQRAKVTRILENTPARIIGICPDPGFAANWIEIATQYVSQTLTQKEPRFIRSPFVVKRG